MSAPENHISVTDLTEPELTPEAAELLTVNGRLNALARNLRRLDGASRDEATAIREERQTLEAIRQELMQRHEATKLDSIDARLADVQTALARAQGRASRADVAETPPLVPSGGAD